MEVALGTGQSWVKQRNLTEAWKEGDAMKNSKGIAKKGWKRERSKRR
jgi:hypothetical protein